MPAALGCARTVPITPSRRPCRGLWPVPSSTPYFRLRLGGPADRGAPDTTAKHQAEALSLLAQIHARAGDWASASKAFSSMPDDRLKNVTALWIASLRADAGDVAGALAWARSLPSSSHRAWALRGLAGAIFDKDLAEQL